MGVEQIINLIGQVVIILAFGIGVLIVIKNLRGKIGVLESQLKSQSDILSKIKDFMSIFDVRKVKDPHSPYRSPCAGPGGLPPYQGAS